jgi:hypothetical protein
VDRPMVIIFPHARALLLFSPSGAPPKQAGCFFGNDLSQGVALYHTICTANPEGESHAIVPY